MKRPRGIVPLLAGGLGLALIIESVRGGRQAVGVLAGLALIALSCVFALARYLRAQREQHDVAEAQVVAEALQRMAELEELHYAARLATVGQLASMAHELGTPLAVVQARAQMIAAGEVDEALPGRDLEAILEQTRRMTQIVHEVLDLARQKTMLKMTVDLAELARQTVSMLEPLARKRSVRLALVEAAPGAMVSGEPSKLLQILTNLTMNALQSMPRGGTVTLAAGTRQARPPEGGDGGAAEHRFVEVRDEGSGIARDDLPRIFDSFFTTKKETEGTGLGLSVSLQLAREHHGWIEVESRAGEGSRFTLYLPSVTA